MQQPGGRGRGGAGNAARGEGFRQSAAGGRGRAAPNPRWRRRRGGGSGVAAVDPAWPSSSIYGAAAEDQQIDHGGK